MVAGGAESTIMPVAMGGFQAMHALSRRNDAPTRASRPFDKGRDGFVCGEGAAVLILESLERAQKRNARIYAELTGYGASSDAFHLTGPSPDGEGCQRSMEMALEDAGLSPEAIDYLNAHATSTGAGDAAESNGILGTFGTHARDRKLAVSSTKSMTGHLLGAAGAVEAAFTILAIRDGMLPPTINMEQQDEACPMDVVPNTARARDVRHAMSNGFGFGGTNASLVFSRT
jgi:3-oxoacyl-[acyl-carrier-protein] synthase II